MTYAELRAVLATALAGMASTEGRVAALDLRLAPRVRLVVESSAAHRNRRYRSKKRARERHTETLTETHAGTLAATDPPFPPHTPPIPDSSVGMPPVVSDPGSDPEVLLPNSKRSSLKGSARVAAGTPDGRTAKRRTAKWVFFPEDYVPGEREAALARELGVSLETALEEIRDHEFAKPRTDAGRTLCRWLRETAKRRDERGFASGVQRRNGATNPNRGGQAALEYTLELMRAEESSKALKP